MHHAAGDMAEYRAIRNALPSHQLRINSTKSMIGHLLGAAGAVEAVATIQALQTGESAMPAPTIMTAIYTNYLHMHRKFTGCFAQVVP